jgi:hypothetical protein
VLSQLTKNYPGIPEIQRRKFEFHFNQSAFEFYEKYEKSKKNPLLKKTMMNLEILLLFENANKYHHEQIVNLFEWDSKPSKGTLSEIAVKCALKIMKSHEKTESHPELTHLFQVMDFFQSFNPNIFEQMMQKSDVFKILYDVMYNRYLSFSNLENIHIYINNKFSPNQWVKTIFHDPRNRNKEFSPLEELEFIAHYLKYCDQIVKNNIKSLEKTPQFLPYYQPRLIQFISNSIQSKIKELANFDEIKSSSKT